MSLSTPNDSLYHVVLRRAFLPPISHLISFWFDFAVDRRIHWASAFVGRGTWRPEHRDDG